MILGLSGKALSGKDTVADYLISKYGWDRKVGFSYNLKEACIEVFGLSEQQVYTQQGKAVDFYCPLTTTEKDIVSVVDWMRSTHNVALKDKDYSHLIGVTLWSPREVLQFVGTEVMRYYVPDYHTEVVFRKIGELENVIIPDVRFPNEAEFVVGRGGSVIRIERPVEFRKKHGLVIDSNHPSEIALDGWTEDRNWDAVIVNNKEGLHNLYNAVDTMVEIGAIRK